MKKQLLNTLTIITVLLMPALNYAQAPVLGTTSNFALFSTVGEVKNIGITYLTHITGNCGSNDGPVNGFGNVDGVMTHTGDPLSMQAKADLLVAHGQLNSTTPTDNTLAPLLGSGPGQVLTAGVYSISSTTITLDQNLILDGEGNSGSVFIFQLQGAFSTNANSKVKLINGALACNVFWKVDGLVDMATATSMKGTIIATAAINMGTNDTLEGRALAINGAITVGGVLVYKPVGCSSPVLTGPSTPVLASAACYTLFSASGQVTNTGISHIIGDIGTNGTGDSTTGYNPLHVTGTIHPYADGSTDNCETDLVSAYNYLNTLSHDIELLYPAEFGHNLTLTPHTYLMNAATVLTDTVFFNAQGNTNAIFVVEIVGAFSTNVNSQIVLINGAKAENIFWNVYGATSINDSSDFSGTIICYGAVSLKRDVVLNGRALVISGDVLTDSITASMPPGCSTLSTDIAGTVESNDILTIYPNPFIDQINIRMNNLPGNQCELKVYDLLGAEVLTTTVSQEITTLETAGLPEGIYFYRLRSGNVTVQTGKLVSRR